MHFIEKKSVHVDSLTFFLASVRFSDHDIRMVDSPEKKTDRYIGRQVTAARNRLRYSQQQVANHLKLSKPAYGDMERGKQRWPAGRLFVVAEFLEVPIDSLFPKQKTPATRDTLAYASDVTVPKRSGAL